MESAKQSVLVIEDDDALRLLFSTLLQKAGFSVRCVPNGRDGLEALEAEPFDAVVLDLMMPLNSGFDVLRKLEESDCRTLSRVIVTTGVNDRQLRTIADVPVFKTIRKPFDIDELVSSVSTCAAQPTSNLDDQNVSTHSDFERIRRASVTRFARKAPELRKALRQRTGSDDTLLKSELRKAINALGTLLNVVATQDDDPIRAKELARIASTARDMIRVTFTRGEKERSH